MANESTAAPFPLHIVPFAVGDFIGGLVVSLENLLIVVTTVKSRALRGPCNILIGVLALVDLISGLGFVQQGLQILSGRVFFSRRACAFIWSLLFFSLDCGSALIFAVGFDRYASLTFPVWYKNLRKKRYFSTVFFLCALFGVSVSLSSLLQTDDSQVICIPPTALNGFTFAYWVLGNLVINVSVVVVYMLAFRRAKELRDAELAASQNAELSRKTVQKHNLMISLVIVVWVYICSWLATMLLLAVFSILPVSESVQFHVLAYCGWLVLINLGSNCIIYFSRSELYRSEMLHLLHLDTIRRPSDVPLIDRSHPNAAARPYGTYDLPCATRESSLAHH